MSPENQQAVINTFESVNDFFDWYNDAKQEYEEFQDKIMNSGSIETNQDVSDGNETTTTSPELNNSQAKEMTYLAYHALSGAQQKKFINSFDSIDAFVAWHNNAKQAYFDSMTELDGSTPIDLDAITIPTEE